MRKIINKLIVSIIGPLIMFGCVGTEIKRTVDENNMFISPSSPQCKIEIDSAFKYTQSSKKTGKGSGVITGEKYTGTKIEKYPFVCTEKNSEIIIKITTLTTSGWYFRPNFYKPEIFYDKGKVKYAGDNYEYCIFPGKKYLVKAIGRMVGANNNIKIEIFYAKKISGTWGKLAVLSEQQAETLNAFIAESEKYIKIIE